MRDSAWQVLQLTLITEFIGMTAALGIFGIPTWLTVIIVIFLMGAMVIQGKYWTWEKLVIFFCLINLIYIPAAFMVHPDVSTVLRQGIIPICDGETGLCGWLSRPLAAD
jgi:Mn2+/Fe2+ NRAMP family transporter